MIDFNLSIIGASIAFKTLSVQHQANRTIRRPEGRKLNIRIRNRESIPCIRQLGEQLKRPKGGLWDTVRR